MFRSTISLLLLLSLELAGCAMAPGPVDAPIADPDLPLAEGINGFRWHTPVTQIPDLELLDGTQVEDGLSGPSGFEAREISSYFRPGDVSPYPGIDIYDIQYIFCFVPRMVVVGLCGGAVEYGSEERLKAFADTEPPEQTNHRRLLSYLVSKLGMPEVRRVTADGRTVAVSTSTEVPYSSTDVMRYTWCRSRPFLDFARCGDPWLILSFDPFRGEGYVLAVTGTLLNTVWMVQSNSTVDYPLFKNIFGPDWASAAFRQPETGTHITFDHLALTTPCSARLASERALAQAAHSSPAHHPISEWEYLRVVDYSPSQSTPELDLYLRGYRHGFMYGYYEGRWRGGEFHEQWMHAADADNEAIGWEGIGYQDGARMIPPQPPEANFDAAEFERFRNAHHSACKHP